jgi:hypothetical protein
MTNLRKNSSLKVLTLFPPCLVSPDYSETYSEHILDGLSRSSSPRYVMKSRFWEVVQPQFMACEVHKPDSRNGPQETRISSSGVRSHKAKICLRSDRVSGF